ncbi:FecR family protein [Novosphingobium clariflavum]|uniref:FecR domain-containing protein n=1 Tax=Novosphingobium clariflavum TaxID=2029884 RepID=A0ABV6S5U5_9SPHN|nr:FecR domain-containing protein [Novosphingobium clariflavum]
MNQDTEPPQADEPLPDAILSQAARWHLASEDDAMAEAMDWDGFTRWLEADPRHRRALDEIALADRLVAEHRASLWSSPEAAFETPFEAPSEAVPAAPQDVSRPAEQRRRAGGRGWRWGGLAIAASLVAVLAVPRFMGQFGADPAEVYATDAASRQVTLADGSTVLLAPRSRLTVAGRGQEHIALSGGALFDIRHDPGRRLEITAGDLAISDIGTRFDVQAGDDAVRVAVVEGKVDVRAEAMDGPLQLSAGSGLAYDRGARTAVVGPVHSGDVGSWKDGRLTYDNAPLALVAGDLHRYAGVMVDVPPALRERRFSGTLIVDSGDAALRDLVQLMGLRLGGHAGAWRLEQP